jgi:hypothetical protein
MCHPYEWEYMRYRAEEARNAMQKADDQRKKPKPAVPGAAPQTPQNDEELVPV